MHRHLDLALLGGVAVRASLEVDDVLVDGILLVVDVGDEVPDPTFGVELVPILTLAFVDQDDPQTLRQEGGLAQALDEDLGRPLELVEDLEVGEEGDRRPGLRCRPGLLEVGRRFASGELLVEDLAVTVDVDLQPLRKRVDHGDTNAVQAA